MQRWRTESSREQQGAHHYDPADFGLDIAELRERFRFYADRFGV
jgi:hypothetical protein